MAVYIPGTAVVMTESVEPVLHKNWSEEVPALNVTGVFTQTNVSLPKLNVGAIKELTRIVSKLSPQLLLAITLYVPG